MEDIFRYEGSNHNGLDYEVNFISSACVAEIPGPFLKSIKITGYVLVKYDVKRVFRRMWKRGTFIVLGGLLLITF